MPARARLAASGAGTGGKWRILRFRWRNVLDAEDDGHIRRIRSQDGPPGCACAAQPGARLAEKLPAERLRIMSSSVFSRLQRYGFIFVFFFLLSLLEGSPLLPEKNQTICPLGSQRKGNLSSASNCGYPLHRKWPWMRVMIWWFYSETGRTESPLQRVASFLLALP